MESLSARFLPAPDQKRARLSVHALGIHHIHDHALEMPIGHDDWVIIHFHEACPALLRDGDVIVPAEHVVIWEPRVHTRYGFDDGSIRHSWLRCYATALPTWLRDLDLVTRQPIPVRDPISAAAWWQLLHAELGAPARDLATISEILHLFLRRLAACREDDIAPGLIAARRLIESQWSQPLGLEALARIAGMSRAYFATAFKAAFACSPMAYAQRLRMEHAAHLLIGEQLSITEVAEHCGYADVFGFSKAFSRHHGSSPRAWRRSQMP